MDVPKFLAAVFFTKPSPAKQAVKRRKMSLAQLNALIVKCNLLLSQIDEPEILAELATLIELLKAQLARVYREEELHKLSEHWQLIYKQKMTPTSLP